MSKFVNAARADINPDCHCPTAADSPVLVRVGEGKQQEIPRTDIVSSNELRRVSGPVLVPVNRGLASKGMQVGRTETRSSQVVTRFFPTGLGVGVTLSAALGLTSGVLAASAALAVLAITISRHEPAVFSKSALVSHSQTDTQTSGATAQPLPMSDHPLVDNDDREADAKAGIDQRPSTAADFTREVVVVGHEVSAPKPSTDRSLPAPPDLRDIATTVPTQQLTAGGLSAAIPEFHEPRAPELPATRNEDVQASHTRDSSVRLASAEKARGTELADEIVWTSVSRTDPATVKAYLAKFPYGKHSQQAQQILSEMTAMHSRDTEAVLAALKKYSEAWSAKDVSDIVALRPGLGRRTVKEELSNVRSIAMRIRPIGSPKIEGNRAAVECIHEVEETFGDGIARARPGTRMTYFLARSDGNWQIQDSH